MTEKIDLSDRKVKKDIREIGITPDLNGYWYISDALKIIIASENKANLCIVRKLYSEIAQKRKTSASAVERGIRHAIGKSFNNGYLNHIYKSPPTNNTILFDLVEKYI